jgi:hypothetical protein
VFECFEIIESDGNVVFPAGNAYFDFNRSMKSPYEEDQQDVQSNCFGANGDILCGNLYESDILEIIKNYEPDVSGLGFKMAVNKVRCD